jgi:hypothetical protein
MKVSDILVSEFSRYYTADELPAFSAPDSDAILHNWAENSVHSLAKRAQGHLGELVVLIDELIRDRKHPLFSELNDATNMEWNVEDTDWRVVKGLLTHMRTGLAEIATVSEPGAREALLRSYRAYECDEGGHRWYIIERVSTQTKVVHVRRIESQGRKLTVEYELTSNELTHTLARLLIDRVLLGDLLGDRYAAAVDHVEYIGADGVTCVLPMAHGQRG